MIRPYLSTLRGDDACKRLGALIVQSAGRWWVWGVKLGKIEFGCYLRHP